MNTNSPTYKSFILATVAASMLSACASAPPRPPTPAPPSGPLFACLAPAVTTADGSPIAGALVTIAGVDGVFRTDQNGYVYVSPVPAGAHELKVVAGGFREYTGTYQIASWDCQAPITLAALPPAHVDPFTYTIAELERFRGSLFTVKAPVPYGPRPGQVDNVCVFAARYYTRAERQICYDAWKARDYTHGVVGPFIDPGYHGQVPSEDFRQNPDAAADIIEEVWDQQLIPIVVVVPDHWGADKGYADHIWRVNELKELEAIYRSARWQRLVRVVMLCWECQDGDRYGWSNQMYVEYLTWLRDVFPNAVRILHTISEIEAPVGRGDETDIHRCNGPPLKKRGLDCLTNGEAWANITPLIHAWFFQSSAFFEPTAIDPHGDGRTNEQHWYDLWDARRDPSYVGRFHRGYAGWPTFSANPPGVNGGHLCAVAAEYMSYPSWWQNRPEEEARRYGQRALELGSCGFMDGGKEPR